VLAALALVPAAGARTVIRAGGPSAPTEAKVAIVGSDRNLAGKRFRVVGRDGAVAARGRLRRAPGDAAPFAHAYRADWSDVRAPGSYRVEVGRARSRAWEVVETGGRAALGSILEYFAANRDGAEPSPIHGPAHLNDAVVHPAAPGHGGTAIAITGGWMDAGDMLHFTQTTAFATAVLEAAALLDPADAAALEAEAGVGVRWLLAAHPFADAFVVQVGDERDHELGFRDPATDDASGLPGIGTRFAYTLGPDRIGGDLGGKAAAALALAHQRTGSASMLAAARQWYAAGARTGAPAPPLKRAGYPKEAGNFYASTIWRDSMATAAIELYRSTGDSAYLDDAAEYLASRDARPDGTLGTVDSFAALGAADACGALGRPPIPPGPALDRSCGLLRDTGKVAVANARSNAFGMPGFFAWGTTAQNGAGGALAALSTVAPGGPGRGCEVASGARDYLLGRNPFGASFVAGYGPKAPRRIHHWASSFGPGLPAGAVVGGPAPLEHIESQGFRVRGPLQSEFAGYVDERRNYVTSEPAIDYAASSILLLAALEARC
jgi:endoglucanase